MTNQDLLVVKGTPVLAHLLDCALNVERESELPRRGGTLISEIILLRAIRKELDELVTQCDLWKMIPSSERPYLKMLLEDYQRNYAQQAKGEQ